VFCIEKVFYSQRWINWILANFGSLPVMIKEDPLTGVFYAFYGTGDIAFAVLFLFSAYKYRHNMFFSRKTKEE